MSLADKGHIHQCFEEVLDMLCVRDVSAVCNQRIVADGEDPLNIFESRKTAETRFCQESEEKDIPKLSAASTTPSLYFIPSTLVPTIFGLCVCCEGAVVALRCVCDWRKDGLTGCIGSTSAKNGVDILNLSTSNDAASRREAPGLGVFHSFVADSAIFDVEARP